VKSNSPSYHFSGYPKLVLLPYTYCSLPPPIGVIPVSSHLPGVRSINTWLIMKEQILTIGILFHVLLLFGQTSLKELGLDHGKYRVGFTHYTIFDSTRTYSRMYDYTNQEIARPIPISIWYPSEQRIIEEEPLKVLDYFEILQEEEEWEYLPNEQLLNWFYYANTSENQEHLREQASAFTGISFAHGKFPVVVYAPSFQASSIENFALCSYLASHGYLVVSSPSRGTDTRWFSNNLAKEIETQARDVEFLIKEVGKYPIANPDKVAVMGFSFGGLSNMIAQMRNSRIGAVVSLDGTERYQYDLLSESPFFDPEKMEVPYLHMAQKDIPETVLKEDDIDPKLNTTFELYDSLTRSTIYRFKYHHLTHAYFSTLGVLFETRDKRQDRSDREIMKSYKWVSNYTLHFLNAYLKDDVSGLAFLENSPADNGVPSDLITRMVKQSQVEEFDFRDFNDLAHRQDYQDLDQLYESTVVKRGLPKLPEGPLNTLGLQLVFNPKTSDQGIKVFLLAVKLYPNSANLYDSLAEGYLFIGEEEKAIEHFEKSLSLNEENQNAIDRLKQLRR